MNLIEMVATGDMRKAPMSEDAKKLFPATRWSLVTQTREPEAAGKALAELCEIYWYPVYAYVRLLGKEHHDAQDLTQSFFATFLSRGDFAKADASIGKLRTFLSFAVKRYVIWSDRKDNRLKRGGKVAKVSLDLDEFQRRFESELHTTDTPETHFERRWARSVLDETLRRLKAEHKAKGKSDLLAAMLPYLSLNAGTGNQGEIAESLGLRVGAFRMSLTRMRQRYHELLKATVADTLTDRADVDAELAHLLTLFQ